MQPLHGMRAAIRHLVNCSYMHTPCHYLTLHRPSRSNESKWINIFIQQLCGVPQSPLVTFLTVNQNTKNLVSVVNSDV